MKFIVENGILLKYDGALADVTVPEGVISIGDGAFEGNTHIVSVALPNGLSAIGKRAFYGCGSLRRVELPESVVAIDEESFGWCSALTAVHIPRGVRTVGRRAFFHCASLSRIKLPLGVEEIGSEAFGWCEALGRVELADTVRSIGEGAFSWCRALTCVKLPATLTHIPKGLFCGCGALKQADIPEAAVSIGEDAFSGCRSLAAVIIPEGVTEIPLRAFYGCSALNEIIIPSGVHTVGERAFYGCGGLGKAVIPDTVSCVGDCAFEGFPEDGVIYCGAELLSALGANDACFIAAVRGFARRYAEGLTDSEENKKWWRPIQAKRTKIYRAFIDDPDMIGYLVDGKIISPKRVEGLYCRTQSGECKALLLEYAHTLGLSHVGVAQEANGDFLIEGGVLKKYLGDGGAVTVPDGVTELGNSAFRENISITSVHIPDSVVKIAKNVFRECVYLKAITVPSSVKSIGSNAFSGCASLRSVTLSEGLTNIGYSAFSKCVSVKSVSVPSTVETVREDAFRGCIALEEIEIPDGVGRIYRDAFYDTLYYMNSSNWTEIGELYIGNHLIKVRPKGISGIYTLRERTVGIADEALGGCEDITELRLPEGLRTVGFSAFADCCGIRALYIPKSAVNLWSESFIGLGKSFIFRNKKSDLEYIFIDVDKMDRLSFYGNTAACAVRGCLLRWESGELDDVDLTGLDEFLLINSEEAISALSDTPLFIRYLIARRLINVKSAREILDQTESPECRALLLEYIEKNSAEDAFEHLDF